MNVDISNRQTDLPLGEDNIQDIVVEIVTFESQKADEVSINFVSTKEICQIHEKYFDDASPTDTISIPMDGPEETHYRVLGEVFVCPQAAIDFGGDPYEETTLYLLHGLLHLMGYEDIHDPTKMRAAEKRHMDHLKTLNLTLRKKG